MRRIKRDPVSLFGSTLINGNGGGILTTNTNLTITGTTINGVSTGRAPLPNGFSPGTDG